MPVGNRAELFAHAVVHDHAARNVGCAFNVVGRAGRNVAHDERLGASAAEQHDDLGNHIAL